MIKMNIAFIKPSVTLLTSEQSIREAMDVCEYGGRTCYQSHALMGRPDAFLRKTFIEKGHESVAGHGHLTFRFVCSRNDAAQIRTYRIANHCQESQRYVLYGKNRDFTFCPTVSGGAYSVDDGMKQFAQGIASMYCSAVASGAKPEVARCFLPGMYKTEIVTTLPFNRVRHFVSQRASDHAQEPIRTLAMGIVCILRNTPLNLLLDRLTLSSKTNAAPHYWWRDHHARQADAGFLKGTEIYSFSSEPCSSPFPMQHGGGCHHG